jgi:hypothetical protein
MDIIHNEHCNLVEHEKTGDAGMNNAGKSSDADSRSPGHNSAGSSHGGASDKASDRDRTKSGHGRWSDSTGTGKHSAREPPPCLNTKNCVFCRPDQCSLTNIYVADNSCLISKYFASLFLRDDFGSRHLHIQMLWNDYTVLTRCRHRGGMVASLGCQACRAIR